MKRISYYIGALVVFGVALVSFWIYQKYFKVEEKNILAFQVMQGNIREMVKARGEVVAQKEFELEFPFGGTIEKALVKEGQSVSSGAPLLKLDTKELEIERTRLQAVVRGREANLEKLHAGAIIEDIRVSEKKVASNERAVVDGKTAILDASLTAFTQADDAIHNKADQFFNNGKTADPTLNLVIADTQLKMKLAIDRAQIEQVLIQWGKEAPFGGADTDGYTIAVKGHLALVKTFLSDLATAVNSAGVTSSVPSATLEGWKTTVSGARANVDTATTGVVQAEEKLRTAESALALARSELALKKSHPQAPEVVIAEAQIEEAKSLLASVEEKIKRSTLRAPGKGVVKKILLEEQEVFKVGAPVLVFASAGFKVQSDISELDVSKVRYTDGNEASIRFDAFPGKVFKGKVVFIEPKEIIKNDDVYFRADIFLDSTDPEVRSGMSADVVLYGASKTGVLVVPELAVEKKSGSSVVKVARGVTRKEDIKQSDLVETKVTTGVSDGENVEILTGLNAGDLVVVSPD